MQFYSTYLKPGVSRSSRTFLPARGSNDDQRASVNGEVLCSVVLAHLLAGSGLIAASR